MSFRIFEKGSNCLPAFSKPYPNESISSWLTRLSFHHGMKRSMLIRLTGSTTKRYLSAWGVDTAFNNKMLAELASYTNCSIEEIKNTTLLTYAGRLFDLTPQGSIPQIWLATKAGETASYRKDYGSGTLFCPSCFAKQANDIYYKKHWRIGISFACLECNCYLRSSCPHCKNGPSDMNDPITAPLGQNINEYMLECRNCTGNVSHCVPVPAPKYIMEMQHQLYQSLDRVHNPAFGGTISFFKLLYKMTGLLLSKRERTPLSRLVRQVYRIHDHVVDLNPELYSISVKTLPLKHQADIFSMALWLLDEWPNRLLELGKEFRVSSSDILNRLTGLPENIVQIIQKELGGFQGGEWRVRKQIKMPPFENELDYFHIKCKNTNDYDYDTDNTYYQEGQNLYLSRIFRNQVRSEYCANDVIYQQMKKAYA
jgi:hypothetical protein